MILDQIVVSGYSYSFDSKGLKLSSKRENPQKVAEVEQTFNTLFNTEVISAEQLKAAMIYRSPSFEKVVAASRGSR